MGWARLRAAVPALSGAGSADRLKPGALPYDLVPADPRTT
jgi:hypothetical protein